LNFKRKNFKKKLNLFKINKLIFDLKFKIKVLTKKKNSFFIFFIFATTV
jgi:hypothetical protein